MVAISAPGCCQQAAGEEKATNADARQRPEESFAAHASWIVSVQKFTQQAPCRGANTWSCLTGR
jgi:hypothetical protein